MNYYERFPGDFIKKTMRLTMLQDGAYNRLLDWQYANEEALPMEPDEQYRIARASTVDEKAAVDTVVARYFTFEHDGGLWPERVVEEIDKARKRMERSRTNGSKGGRPGKLGSVPRRTEPTGLNAGYEQDKGGIAAPDIGKQQAARSPDDMPVFLLQDGAKEGPEGAEKPAGLDSGNPAETQDLTQKKAPHTPYPNKDIPTTSDGEAPSEPQAAASDPEPPPAVKPLPDRIFGDGLSFVISRGVVPKSARSFIGLMRAKLTDPVVWELLQEVERQDITEPIAWLRKSMDNRLAQGSASKRPLSLAERAAADVKRAEELFGAN
jgi:uncharacterized protein YdaU (DUF1376 family)